MALYPLAMPIHQIAKSATSVWKRVKPARSQADLTEIAREEEEEKVVEVGARATGQEETLPHGKVHKAEVADGTGPQQLGNRTKIKDRSQVTQGQHLHSCYANVAKT